MPLRKDASISASQAQQDASSDGIDAFELPKSIVTRIAKSALPNDAKLQKETIGALVKGSTVFINYLAATAQDVASSRSHKTIGGADVLKALEIIEFGDLVPVLQGELDMYRGGKAKGKAPADTKGKGKEASSPSAPAAAESDTAPLAVDVEPGDEGVVMHDDVLMNTHEEEEEGSDGDEDMADAEPEADVEEEDDVEEPEELVDTVAVEENEIKRDQLGLEGDIQPQVQDGA